LIIIPEIETVIILVPRTGTKSLKKAISNRYASAMPIYRHMEADGIPDGYERWRKIGIVRDPLERLWSLYKYLQTFDGPYPREYIAEQRDSVAMPFSTWLVINRLPFTQPYDSSGRGKFFPGYNVRHNLPENRKSQHVYLRPDLGTQVFQFSDLQKFGEEVLKLHLPHINASTDFPLPYVNGITALGDEDRRIIEYMLRWFAWDIVATRPKWADGEIMHRAIQRVRGLPDGFGET
jgi:hypothetical protein